MGSSGPPGVRSESAESPLASVPKAKKALSAVIPGGRGIRDADTGSYDARSMKPHNGLRFSGERSGAERVRCNRGLEGGENLRGAISPQVAAKPSQRSSRPDQPRRAGGQRAIETKRN